MKGIKFRTFVKWVIGVGISVLLIGGFVWSRSRWIPAGHVGVVYDASRGLLPEVIKPKRVFIGWRQQLYTYPTQLMNALYTQDPTAGEVEVSLLAFAGHHQSVYDPLQDRDDA